MTHVKGRTSKSALNNAREKYVKGVKGVNWLKSVPKDENGMKTYRVIFN